MAISLITVIITQMYYQSSTYLPMSDLVIKRQKAQMLALGGVQMGLSKLNGSQDQVTEQAADSTEKKKSKQSELLGRLLSSINRWQTVTLSEEVEGVIGEIKVCVSCENGKINLNQLYNFENHTFSDVKKNDGKTKQLEPENKSAYEKILHQTLTQIATVTKNQFDSEAAFNALVKFLAARDYQLLDVTELLEIPEFSYFNKQVFYEPPSLERVNPSIYLTDIFTIWTDQVKLQPWLLSDSLLAILGFPRAQPNDIMKRNSAVADWTKYFKESVAWQNDWDKTLGLVYDTKFGDFSKEVVNFFDTKFNPQVFSVLSYGKVGGVTQKIYAIVRLQSKSKDRSFFVVEKLYWI